MPLTLNKKIKKFHTWKYCTCESSFNSGKRQSEKTYLMLFLALLLSPASILAFDISNIVSGNIERNVSTAISSQLNQQFFKAELEVKNQVDTIRNANISDDKKFLSTVLSDNSVRLWNLETGSQQASYRLSGNSLAIPIKDAVLSANQMGTLEFHNGLNQKLINTTTHRSKIVQLDASLDYKVIVSADQSGTLALWDNHTFERPMRTFNTHLNITHIDIHASKRSILIRDTTSTVLLDTQTGDMKKLCHTQEQRYIKAFHFINNNQFLSADTSGNISVCSLTTDNAVWTHKLIGSAPFSYSYNSATQQLFIADQEGLIYAKTLFNNDKQRRIHTVNKSVNALFSNHSGDRILAALGDGTIRVIDPINHKELLRVIMTYEGWSVIDLHGRYDASAIASKEIVWHASDQRIEIEAFYQLYFEPGLLANYFASNGQALVNVPATIPDGIALPPSVELSFPDGPPQSTELATLLVTATDKGGGIDTISLYHNGKRVNPEDVLLTRDVERNNQRLRITAYRVSPTVGINNFKAVAQGLWKIEGQSERINLTIQGNSKKPKAHLVAVGINQYSDPALNLQYSVPDAQSIINAFNTIQVNQSNYQWIVHDLFNEKATGAAILKTLSSLQQTNKEDIIVLYFAGHGIVIDQSWQFLPYETTMQSNISMFKKFAISTEQIQDILVKSNAQRILMLVDSCHSGAGVEAFKKQALFQKKHLYSFGRSTGITLIAAARRDQLAAEMQQLGHGIFTFALLEGLKGNADQAPKDNSVTAHELSGFVSKMVPQLATQHLDYSQQPVSYALGADFILK